MQVSESNTFKITENAAKQVLRLLEEERKTRDVCALRIGVRGGGCSGLSYFMEFTKEIEPRDKVFTQSGLTFYIDPKSYIYLNGTELEFSTNVQESGFLFRNPNQKKSCGCGESFTV